MIKPGDILVAADELLLHQVGRPFSQTSISDHRFYDRHWICAYDRVRDLGFMVGMGVYKNTNVLDGYVSIQTQRRQHNLRLSRVLRPDIEHTRVGPLHIEIVEPFRHLRITIGDNAHGISGRIDWRSDYAVHLEAFHADMVSGMITQENTRYDQVGSASGWLLVDGERIAVEDWWSVRDHSWGTRPGVGGFEPVRGDHALANPPQLAGQIRLWLWSCLSTADYSLQMQRIEDRDGKLLHLDGDLRFRPALDREALQVTAFDHDITFAPGTKAVESLRYRVALSDGTELDIQGEPSIRAWAYRGSGYDRGYNDGLGLGAQRGNLTPEHDVYDLSHMEKVLDAAGEEIPPGHREQPVRLTVNGVPTMGHFPVMLFDTQPGM